MTSNPRFHSEWFQQVPAVVFGCLLPSELRITLCPGHGMADGGAPCDVPMDIVPIELRIPNTPLWVQFDDNQSVVRIWRREKQADEK
jgi:hypothetical protein